jgi:hypothetical protein
MASLPQPISEGDAVPLTGPLPPPKPMASCRRVSLYRREIHLSPSAAALEILFSLASQLSEGQRDGDGWLGSTMITVDLERVAHLVSDACDAATARRLAELAAQDDRVKAWARGIGLHAAERAAGGPLIAPAIDVRVRAAGHHLHIDVDVEGKLAAATGTP